MLIFRFIKYSHIITSEAMNDVNYGAIEHNIYTWIFIKQTKVWRFGSDEWLFLVEQETYTRIIFSMSLKVTSRV